MKIKKRSLFPKWIRHFKELKGISVGECVDSASAISDEHIGHAHACNGDPHQGWICLKYKFHLTNKLTLLHEVAHLIANKKPGVRPHGKEWKKVVVDIGGTFKSFVYKRGSKYYRNLDYTYRNNKQ